MVKEIIAGEVTDLSKLRKTIAALRENMELEINSPGGSVIEGLQTINLIQKSPYKITATVEVMACSIAAVIALSCDKIKIKSTDIMVLHNSMTITMGNKEQLQQDIDTLTAIDNILHDYITAKCKKPDELIAELETGKDVWLTGEQVAELFTDVELVKPLKAKPMQNCVDFSRLVDSYQLAEAKKNEVVNRILKEYELNKAKDEARRMAISKRIAAEKF